MLKKGCQSLRKRYGVVVPNAAPLTFCHLALTDKRLAEKKKSTTEVAVGNRGVFDEHILQGGLKGANATPSATSSISGIPSGCFVPTGKPRQRAQSSATFGCAPMTRGGLLAATGTASTVDSGLDVATDTVIVVVVEALTCTLACWMALRIAITRLLLPLEGVAAAAEELATRGWSPSVVPLRGSVMAVAAADDASPSSVAPGDATTCCAVGLSSSSWEVALAFMSAVLVGTVTCF